MILFKLSDNLTFGFETRCAFCFPLLQTASNSLFAIFYDLPWNFQVFFKLLKFVLVCIFSGFSCQQTLLSKRMKLKLDKSTEFSSYGWDKTRYDSLPFHSVQFSSEMANNNMIVEWRMKNDMMTMTLSCNWLYL